MQALELYHYQAPRGNFGDDLNLWLWDSLLPGWRQAMPGHMLVGVGTIINDKLPRGIPKLVMGSGVGYGAMPPAELLAECTFAAVRGPRSAAMLGLPPEKGIVDPAVMLPGLPEFQNIPRGGRPVFVPHIASVDRADWGALCKKAGIDYVSPEGDAHEVIRRLASAPLVVTESMHGAIIADAFGTPWQAVSISYLFHARKWMDWADSLGIDLRVEPMFPLMDRISALLPKKRRPAGDHPTEGKAGSGAQGAAQRLPFKLRARMAMERQMAVARLRKLARSPGQLSDRARLEAARARYRAVLDAVRQGF